MDKPMRLDPTEAEEAQCDAMISLAVDGSRCLVVECVG